jgi:hypothetical protein
MLKHRLFSKTLPKTFDDVLERPMKDLDQNLRQQSKVIENDTRTMIIGRRNKVIGRRNKVIGQLKLDMMAIYISTAEATARGHARIAKEEKEKMRRRRRQQQQRQMIQQQLIALKSDAENVAEGEEAEEAMISNMINAIQARQENIIKRAQYVAACKVSFFDETPTLIN